MSDLDSRQVEAQLESLGLSPLDEEDLQEITHRINALREALAALEPELLDEQEPRLPFHPETASDDV